MQVSCVTASPSLTIVDRMNRQVHLLYKPSDHSTRGLSQGEKHLIVRKLGSNTSSDHDMTQHALLAGIFQSSLSVLAMCILGALFAHCTEACILHKLPCIVPVKSRFKHLDEAS